MPVMITIPGYLTYRQVSARLRLSHETVRKYCQREIFERVYIEHLPLVTETSVTQYEKNRRRPGNPNFKSR